MHVNVSRCMWMWRGTVHYAQSHVALSMFWIWRVTVHSEFDESRCTRMQWVTVDSNVVSRGACERDESWFILNMTRPCLVSTVLKKCMHALCLSHTHTHSRTQTHKLKRVRVCVRVRASSLVLCACVQTLRCVTHGWGMCEYVMLHVLRRQV